MMTNPAPRPAEWLHTPRCLAAAMICAVENMRDAAPSAHAFRLQAQDNDALTWADEYLASGTASCMCHTWDIQAAEDSGPAFGTPRLHSWTCSCGARGTGFYDAFAAARAAREHDETATA